MAKEILKRGATSNILRVFLQDSASTTGAGKTALTSTSSGLIISTIADLEATATTYTSAATNVETITTLGTFAAPTAGKCRFREVDATNFPGVYEIHIADARFAVVNSSQLLISIQCTGVAPVFVEYQIVAIDLMDTVRFGLTALPSIAQGNAGALITSGTGTAQLSVTSGVALANATQWNSVGVTGMPMPTYTQPTGFLAASFPTSVASPTNITAGTITTVSGNVNGSVASVTGAVGSVTGNVGGNVAGSVNSVTSAVTVGTINANVITATSIAADAITAAKIATGAIDADAIAADAITAAKIANSAISIRLATDGTPSEARIETGAVAADVWNALLASYATANSFGARIVRTRSTSPSNEVTITGSFHIASDVHELQPGVIIAADFAAGAIDANALATSAVEEIADAILKRNLDSSGNEVSTTSNGRTVRNALRILRNKVDASGGTQVDVYNEADTTVIWSQPITTNASADPIVKVGA
jgi:hypothetical protein